MHPSYLRVGAWSGAAAASAAVAGLGWLAQPVQVPLIGLLVLTFVPTSDLITAVRTKLPNEKQS